MIIGFVIIVALVIAGVIVLGTDGRPSLTRTLCGILFVVVAVGFPFLFEEGCGVADGGPRVVTRSPNGVLTAHERITWCPKHCVDVPNEIKAWLTLPNGIRFKVVFPVEDPVALVRALELDRADRVVSTEEVERAAQRAVGPLINGYVREHEDALLRRPLLQQRAFDETQRELASYLKRSPPGGDAPPTRLATLGLKFRQLCCAELEGAASQ